MRDSNGTWLKIGDPVEIEWCDHKYKNLTIESFNDNTIKINVRSDFTGKITTVTPLNIRKLEIEELI